MDLYNLVVSAKLTKGEGGDVDVDSLSVTENGTYTAQSGHAYNPVVVNVPSVTPTGNINITSTAQTDVSAYATAQVVDADLVASNIKKDVDILGVVGTYEGGGGGGGSADLAGLISRTATSLDIPTGITVIGDSAIAYTNITRLVVPEGVTRINNSGLRQNTSMEYLELPSTLNYIDNYALFGHATNAASPVLVCKAVTPPTVINNAFGSMSSNITIYVPSGSVESYKVASKWSSYASKIQAISE